MRTDSFAFPTRWGGQLIGRNEARFRIWAPGVETLDLDLDGKSAPMERDPEGWFELVADGVREGAAYSFVLPDGRAVPDPAARAQAGDVHGPSRLVDPVSYSWRNAGWHGRPWEEAVLYELHVGAFTEEGTFAAASGKLPYLADLGFTAVELMPVAQFGGDRGWGYDGVLLYAPHNAYGSPDDLKAFIDAAHGHGLMVLLDVVYNHFGPDGNYLHLYAPDFFHQRRRTPWGDAIAYERVPVRAFFIDNALYWLQEFQLDGLRLDAVDNIVDDRSEKELLVEMAERIRAELPGRHIHLATEDNRNVTHLHERDPDGAARLYTAEWNDDLHNAAHVIATGEIDGYYADFAEAPYALLAKALAEGFAYQGEHSVHAGHPRGAPSAHLPPPAFVDFLQNHDQVGNRALGERLSQLADPRVLELLSAVLLLSPHVPLLFMGEEYGETRPFLFFTDFHGELARAVREGRRREFARFAAFAGHEDDIADPNMPATLESSRLDWSKASRQPAKDRLERTRALLALRRMHIVPRLAGTDRHCGTVLAVRDGAIAVAWQLEGAALSLRLNLAAEPCRLPEAPGKTLYADPPDAPDTMSAGDFPPLSVLVTIDPGDSPRTSAAVGG